MFKILICLNFSGRFDFLIFFFFFSVPNSVFNNNDNNFKKKKNYTWVFRKSK